MLLLELPPASHHCHCLPHGEGLVPLVHSFLLEALRIHCHVQSTPRLDELLRPPHSLGHLWPEEGLVRRAASVGRCRHGRDPKQPKRLLDILAAHLRFEAHLLSSTLYSFESALYSVLQNALPKATTSAKIEPFATQSTM